MSGVLKGMLIVLLIVYVISPVDFCLGPVDDIIAVLLGICTTVIPSAKNMRAEEI